MRRILPASALLALLALLIGCMLGCTLDSDSPGEVTGMLLRRDGKLVVVTKCGRFGDQAIGPLFRLHPDGRLDPTFDTRYLAAQHGHNHTTRVRSMVEDRAGRIVAAIEQHPTRESGWLFRIVRLLDDGSLDAAFGAAVDSALAEYRTASPRVRLALRPGGGYLLALRAHGREPERGHAHLIWLDEDGALRHRRPLPELAVDGVQVPAEPTFLITRSDSSFVMAGHAERHRHHYWSLLGFRADPAGDCAVDLAIGPLAGTVREHRGPRLGRITSLAAEPDGGLVVVTADSILRVRPDGTADPGFRFDPAILQSATPRGLVVQGDGRLVLGTHAAAYRDTGGTLPGLLRLNADGTVDEEFLRRAGVGPRPLGSPLHVIVQPDDAILVGGRFATCGEHVARSLVRLGADGACDTTFAARRGLDW